MLCEISTPAETTFSEDAVEVIAPIADGWIGILCGHAPFVARLMRGQIVVRQADRRRLIATVGGLIETDGTAVWILTGAAMIDAGLAALERERGEELGRVEQLEKEAEKHFDRVYKQLARTFGRGG